MASFISLYETLTKKIYNKKDFQELFAVSLGVCAKVWPLIKNMNSQLNFHRKHLLWALYHLRHYTPLDHNFFNVCSRTFRLWAWKILDVLYNVLDEIFINERDEMDEEIRGTPLADIRLHISMITSPIRRPIDPEMQREMYSVANKAYVLKYEICTRPKDGKICWIYGPVPGGTSEMDTIHEGGVFQFLDKEERIIGGGNLKDNPRVVVESALIEYATQKGVGADLAVRFLDKTNSNQEKTLNILNSFQVISGLWRHELPLHKYAFSVSAQLTNLILLDSEE